MEKGHITQYSKKLIILLTFRAATAGEIQGNTWGKDLITQYGTNMIKIGFKGSPVPYSLLYPVTYNLESDSICP